jgi:DNA recombination protein RmuC
MEIIIYCFASLATGFLLAWLLKKTPVNTRELEHQLETTKTKAAALGAEKQYLEEDKARLLVAIEKTRLELGESNRLVTEYQTRLATGSEILAAAQQDFKMEKEQHWQTKKEGISLQNDNHRLKAELRFKEEQLAALQQQLAETGDRFTREFQVLAQKILDEKTASFHATQEASLSSLLNPLKENIRNFKEEFEAKYKTESDDRISLREQLKQMMELNNTLSTQANNLTNALRGQVKQQGNWGEMILESILEYADLQKGLHYFVQERTEGEDGNALQPDIIVRYPDKRSIVIDSKVSLLHFEQYSHTADADTQQAALSLLLQSVYRHIDGLSGKKYQEAVGALDFVILFVPVEGAYITVMQADRDLWQYAYRKRVLLISPTNLIADMKLVYDLWKREGINQNAAEIAEKAVRIYEKLAAFVEDFEKVGTQLDKAGASFREAQKKLHTGRGNVISQALQMKQKVQHTQPNRELPTHLTDEAMAQDE